MIDVSFEEIYRRLVGADLPDTDLILGIGRGGLIPAAIISFIKGAELRTARFMYRDDEQRPKYPEPVAVGSLMIPEGISSVLIVDDVSVSGKTLLAARKLAAPRKVWTCVLKGKADFVIFPEFTECVNWPWKRYCTI